MKKKLSHTDESGSAKMVDVGHKPQQLRIAKATGFIRMHTQTLKLIRENNIKKGDVLKMAEFAGIQAAKQTPAMIPLCHSLYLTQVRVSLTISEEGVKVLTECRCTGQTGVEMEALSAATVALLTIYDMCKAVDRSMTIEGISVIEKSKNDL